MILVCNKVDNNDQIYSSHEFYALGLGDPFCISSMSGSGTGDLMDAILAALPAETVPEEDEDLPHITIVGRPNVGKSSMTNAFAGRGTQHRDLDRRHHPRLDPHPLQQVRHGFLPRGHGRHAQEGKAMEDLEFYSVMRSIRAIENSDVCILMLDAQQGLESQDLNIHNLIVATARVA